MYCKPFGTHAEQQLICTVTSMNANRNMNTDVNMKNCTVYKQSILNSRYY